MLPGAGERICRNVTEAILPETQGGPHILWELKGIHSHLFAKCLL